MGNPVPISFKTKFSNKGRFWQKKWLRGAYAGMTRPVGDTPTLPILDLVSPAPPCDYGYDLWPKVNVDDWSSAVVMVLMMRLFWWRSIRFVMRHFMDFGWVPPYTSTSMCLCKNPPSCMRGCTVLTVVGCL